MQVNIQLSSFVVYDIRGVKSDNEPNIEVSVSSTVITIVVLAENVNGHAFTNWKNTILYLEHEQINYLTQEKYKQLLHFTIPGECVRGMDIEIPDTRTNSKEGKYILKMW